MIACSEASQVAWFDPLFSSLLVRSTLTHNSDGFRVEWALASQCFPPRFNVRTCANYSCMIHHFLLQLFRHFDNMDHPPHVLLSMGWSRAPWNEESVGCPRERTETAVDGHLQWTTAEVSFAAVLLHAVFPSGDSWLLQAPVIGWDWRGPSLRWGVHDALAELWCNIIYSLFDLGNI